MFTRRTILAALLYGVSGAALASAPAQSLRPLKKPSNAAKLAVPKAARFVEAANLGGKISFAVADARTGEILESMNPVLGLPPASVTKSVTALFALDKLGPGHRFRTRLMGTGPVQGGVLKGDLILLGGGDPVLGTDDLYTMASKLKAAGVTKITGDLLVEGGMSVIDRIDDSQPEHVGYNPAIAGLNLNFNRVFLEWKRQGSGYAVTMDARSDNLRPAVGFARTTVAARDIPIFSYSGNGGRDNWSVARGALGRGGGRWLPVRRPEIYAGDVLQSVARSHGISLPFPKRASGRPKGQVLVEHQSPPLSDILRGMLKFSTNLTAEVVGLQTSGGGSLKGSAGAMSDWLRSRHGLKKARFVDHSGLGDRSKISASEMVKAMVAAAPAGQLKPILKEIAPRRFDNDVAKGSKVKIRAKTGTLNFVSALSGYVTTASGRELAFAIFAADTGRRSLLQKSERERPRGAKSWNGRAKRLQNQLLARWAELYDE